MTDPTNTSLDERIAAALKTIIPCADAREILTAARLRLRRFEHDLANAERDALDPTTTPSKVRAARDRFEDLKFDRQRTLTSIAALEARVEELESEETEQSAAAAHAAIVARRDDLAVRLKERVPALLDELAGLFAEVRELDAQLPAGVMSAEAAARGCPGNFYWPNGGGPVTRLTQMTLPAFNGSGKIWPVEKRIDFGAQYNQQIAAGRAERERQAKAAAAADRLAAHPWRKVSMSPHKGYRRIVVETMEGRMDITTDGSARLRMSDAQAEDAKAKGATVELVKDDKAGAEAA